jgi:hypothetical protein
MGKAKLRCFLSPYLKSLPFLRDARGEDPSEGQQSFFRSLPLFKWGNKDLKRRTGSWRVWKILATVNLAVWVGIAILFWLGLGNLNSWWVLTIALPSLLVAVAYPNLYHMPQRKHSE